MLFIVVLFLSKTTSIFKNKETYQKAGQENGLIYSNATLQDLVKKDTDGDSVLDWEEGLWGTDPTKAETTPGVRDDIAIQKIKTEQDKEGRGGSGATGETENLTKTEQLSRELFTTIVTLNQNGVIDEATINKLGDSLVEQIKKSVQRKVYTSSDIKISENDTKQAIQKYNEALNNTYKKYKIQKGVFSILEELIANEEDASVLLQLDPIIKEITKVINELLKMEVPKSLSLLHLDLINNSQKLLENIIDIKLFDSDPVVAISAVGQYEKNAGALDEVAKKLTQTIIQKLNN